MRHTLPILAALAGFTAGLPASTAAAEGYGRRLAQAPLPPEVRYPDPRPRFRLPPPGPVVGAPVTTYVVRGYQPRATNQPIYNEPPQPLR